MRIEGLEGKVALVTGGGHGIGRAYCLGFGRSGARVVVADIDAEAAERVAAEVREAGSEALAVRVDVADEASTLAMAKAILERWGRIDVLVNNAAMFSVVPMSRGGIEEIAVAEWDRMMAVNLRGPFLCVRAVLPAMKEQRSGAIVNISSGTALSGPRGRIHYVTSKAGILGFTRTLANEVGEYGIRVNAVAPGSTLSEENPSEETLRMRQSRVGDRALKRVQVPDDLVGAVLFFSSPLSGFVTGQTLVVDGGATMH